jgi:hypothetical protein
MAKPTIPTSSMEMLIGMCSTSSESIAAIPAMPMRIPGAMRGSPSFGRGVRAGAQPALGLDHQD